MNLIPSYQWQRQIDQNLFYSDLRAMLDGVEAGVIQQQTVDQWMARQGYRLDWTNYNLEKLQHH